MRTLSERIGYRFGVERAKFVTSTAASLALCTDSLYPVCVSITEESGHVVIHCSRQPSRTIQIPAERTCALNSETAVVRLHQNPVRLSLRSRKSDSSISSDVYYVRAHYWQSVDRLKQSREPFLCTSGISIVHISESQRSKIAQSIDRTPSSSRIRASAGVQCHQASLCKSYVLGSSCL